MGQELEVEWEVARRVAREAGRIILEVYGTEFEVEHKAHGAGPVTLADARANTYLVDALRSAFPDDGIVAEESVDASEVSRSHRCWFVDPLDGTAEFVARNGMFAVHVGLAVNGAAKLGVVYAPATDKLYAGIVGGRCELETPDGVRALRMSPAPEPAALRLTVSRSHKAKKTQKVIDALGITRVVEHGSVGLKCGLLAEGAADLYLHPSGGSWRWDSCAPEAVLRAAGGVLTDFEGRPYRYDVPELQNLRGMIGCSAEAFDALLPLIRRSG